MREQESKQSKKGEALQSEGTAHATASVESGAGQERARKRPLWLHFIVLLFQVLFFVPCYTVIFALSVGAGVGWYYYDQSASLDLDIVERPEIGALVKDVHGTVIGRAGSMNRLLIERNEIPDHFVDALVAAEDQRFFLHPGFDPLGSVRAALANLQADSIREGGSTLTQQLARDVYRMESRDIDRKLSEIAASIRIEGRYSKDEILVHYLNRVYFGSGFYGLGAAARGYFGKKPIELTVDEAALICGVIPSPSRYSPFVNAARAKEYRDQTLRRMTEIGKLDPAERDRLLAVETKLASSRDDQIARGQISHLIARVERELREDMERWERVPESLDGYIVETSIDLATQIAAARSIDRHLNELSEASGEGKQESEAKNPLEGAFIMIENATGQIVVSVGSRDYQRSEYDRAVEMKRTPGSAFYPFLYAAAFETQHFTPATRIVDAPFDNREMGLGGIGGVLGEWSTENPENRWEGAVTAADALARSKNSPTARLALHVGYERVQKMARAVGIESPLREMPSSLLGASEASLTELTRAYSVFPNGGTPAPSLHLIRKILDEDGRAVSRPTPAMASPAMRESTAQAIVQCLPESTKLSGAKGKTGTTATFTDAWYFGFDEEHTWGVWVGRDRYSPIRSLAYAKDYAQPLAESILSSWLNASTAPALGPVEVSTAP